MRDERVSLDTNILIYSIDRDAGEKQLKAIDLIVECATSRDCVLTLQALAEFYFAATRKGKISVETARRQVADWQLLFPTILPSVNTLGNAIDAVRDHKLSFWDAMLWSVARENGVTRLYSEDFQAGQSLGGVEFVNPFR